MSKLYNIREWRCKGKKKAAIKFTFRVLCEYNGLLFELKGKLYNVHIRMEFI